MTYLNLKTSEGVETVDSVDPKDFETRKEFKKELWSLKENYHKLSMPVYFSKRCTNDWKEASK